VVFGRRYCCKSCQKEPEKRVLLTGQKGSGKTSLLYYLHSGVDFDVPKVPTLGYNYEVISFSPFKSYEFVDCGGSDIQQENLWTVFTDAVSFDYIIYVIDMAKYLQKPDKDKYGHFKQDRDNLKRIVSAINMHKHKKSSVTTQLIVYMNYREQDEVHVEEAKREVGKRLRAQKNMLRALLIDQLGLTQDKGDKDRVSINSDNFVDTVIKQVVADETNSRSDGFSLVDKLDIDLTVDRWETYCYSGWLGGYYRKD